MSQVGRSVCGCLEIQAGVCDISLGGVKSPKAPWFSKTGVESRADSTQSRATIDAFLNLGPENYSIRKRKRHAFLNICLGGSIRILDN